MATFHMNITPGKTESGSNVSKMLPHPLPASTKNKKLLPRLLPASANLVLPAVSASASLVPNN